MPNPRLPPEILLHVISFLNWTDKQTLVSLTKTSRTVRTFTLPKLYHSPYPANWLLLRTLHENPELGQHVDSLTLHCDEIKNEDERGRFFSGEDIDGDMPGYDEDMDENEDRSTLMEARDPTIMEILDTFGIDPKSLLGQESINASEYGAWCLLILYLTPNLRTLNINTSTSLVRLIFPPFFDPDYEFPTPCPRCFCTLTTVNHTYPLPLRDLILGPRTIYPLLVLPRIESLTLARGISFAASSPYVENQNTQPSYIPSTYTSTLRRLTLLTSYLPPSSIEPLFALMPKLSYFRHDDANSIDTWAPDFLCAMLHRTPARHSLEALDLRRLTLLERIDALGYDMEDEDMRSTLLEEMEEAPGSIESGFIPWSQGFENLKSCWLNRKYWMHNGEVYKDKADQAAKFRPPKCVDWRLTEGGESYRDALGGSYLRL